jgi:hypothetical protein
MGGAYHEKECPYREINPLTRRVFWIRIYLEEERCDKVRICERTAECRYKKGEGDKNASNSVFKN